MIPLHVDHRSLQTLMPSGVDVTQMLFMTGLDTSVAGIEGCRVTRCGYTGEDGYEVSRGNASYSWMLMCVFVQEVYL